MNFLKKILIKNYENIKDCSVRNNYGVLAGIIGIVSNFVIFALKLLIGLISGSISIVADAVNNFTDAGSSIFTILGFKFASKPADSEHPYGHERYEYIAGLVISFMVIVVGIFLLKSSVEKIFFPEDLKFDVFTFAILLFSIVVKSLQAYIYLDFSKSINSKTLFASYKDAKNDIISTAGVLISVLVMSIGKLNIDGYIGLIISIYIVISGISLAKETTDPLLGTSPDPALVKKIESKILSYDGVLGLHDLIIHKYGHGKCYATVHVEICSKDTLINSHETIDKIERYFLDNMNIKLVIHIDPVETGNKEYKKFKSDIENLIHSIDDSFSIHDFRVVKHTSYINILFDVVIPFESYTTLEDVKKVLRKEYRKQTPRVNFIINLDRPFV